MNLTRTRTQLIAAGVVGLGAVFALALPAGAAVTTASPPAPVVKLGSTASLQANGAAVIATVKVTCQSGSSIFGSVAVAENVAGGFIASGNGAIDGVRCTGRAQTIQQSVMASQRAFTKGVAFGSARITVCSPSDCPNVYDEHEIQIKS